MDAHLLRPHESLIPELLKETTEGIKRDGYVRTPILVENRHHIILDGHHRYQALLDLGCKRIPAYLVDYFDEGIRVETWPGAVVDHITKEEVVEAALRGHLFPPKTTRHIPETPPEDSVVRLEDLV
ncbi:MAG: ParB N-terminal domain-containing protein [Thermoplasmata archaeon]